MMDIRGLASMVYNIFDKNCSGSNTSGGAIKNVKLRTSRITTRTNYYKILKGYTHLWKIIFGVLT